MTATIGTASTQIEVNGASIYVEDRGQGQPLVLVQPGLVSSAVYSGIAPLLANHFRVITFDNRGHGRSTNPTGELSYELLVDDTAAITEALDLDGPIVGGWSDGGEVALQFGLRYPGVARALIVGAASLVLGTAKARADIRTFFHVDENHMVDFDAVERDMRESLIPMLQSSHGQGANQWQTVVQKSASMWLTFTGLTREQFDQIKEPSLVVMGDRDEFVPVEEAVLLYRRLPNAELAILPGASHMRPVFDPDSLVRVIVDFVHRH